MFGITKTEILPYIGLICLIVHTFFGVDIDMTTQGLIASTIVGTLSVVGIVYGIIKNHRQPKPVEIPVPAQPAPVDPPQAV